MWGAVLNRKRNRAATKPEVAARVIWLSAIAMVVVVKHMDNLSLVSWCRNAVRGSTKNGSDKYGKYWSVRIEKADKSMVKIEFLVCISL